MPSAPTKPSATTPSTPNMLQKGHVPSIPSSISSTPSTPGSLGQETDKAYRGESRPRMQETLSRARPITRNSRTTRNSNRLIDGGVVSKYGRLVDKNEAKEAIEEEAVVKNTNKNNTKPTKRSTTPTSLITTRSTRATPAFEFTGGESNRYDAPFSINNLNLNTSSLPLRSSQSGQTQAQTRNRHAISRSELALLSAGSSTGLTPFEAMDRNYSFYQGIKSCIVGVPRFNTKVDFGVGIEAECTDLACQMNELSCKGTVVKGGVFEMVYWTGVGLGTRRGQEDGEEIQKAGLEAVLKAPQMVIVSTWDGPGTRRTTLKKKRPINRVLYSSIHVEQPGFELNLNTQVLPVYYFKFPELPMLKEDDGLMMRDLEKVDVKIPIEDVATFPTQGIFIFHIPNHSFTCGTMEDLLRELYVDGEAGDNSTSDEEFVGCGSGELVLCGTKGKEFLEKYEVDGLDQMKGLWDSLMGEEMRMKLWEQDRPYRCWEYVSAEIERCGRCEE